MLADKVGHKFDAVITGVTDHGTFARLLRPPAEGMVVKGAHGMDVGDRVDLRLVHVDPEKGHIDLAR